MDPRVYKAASLIRQNLQHELNLAEMASSFNLSSSRLRHIFTDEMGVSPRRYHKRLRIQAAKELLETTFLNVKQIMLQVGIKDGSRFARDFSKLYGLTPTQYRIHFLKSSVESDKLSLSQ